MRGGTSSASNWSILTSGAATFASLTVGGSAVNPASYVNLADNQTVGGEKTFTGCLYGANQVWGIEDDGNAFFASMSVGGVSVLPANYVTLAGNQIITGRKTFTQAIYAHEIMDADEGNILVGNPNNTDYVILQSDTELLPGTAIRGRASSGYAWSILSTGAASMASLSLSGDLSLASSSHIDVGPLRIEYDATNKALHITKRDTTDTTNYGLYADGFVAAGGVQTNA